MNVHRLFVLNRDLCVRQPHRNPYELAPKRPSLTVRDVPSPDVAPVMPRLGGVTSPAAPAHRGSLGRGMAWGAMGLLLLVVNLCVLGVQRVGHFRTTYQLSQQLQTTERTTRQLMLANRSLSATLAVQASRAGSPLPDARVLPAALSQAKPKRNTRS